jgi:hypothetical protein
LTLVENKKKRYVAMKFLREALLLVFAAAVVLVCYILAAGAALLRVPGSFAYKAVIADRKLSMPLP